MSDVKETGTRARTRLAILDAAIAALAGNTAATLGEIAVAADVGRTTLHRYFPERTDLLTAVNAEALRRLQQVTNDARLTEGTGAAALLRLSREYFELGDLLSLLFNAPHLVTDPAWKSVGEVDDEFTVVVRRGHRDGTIDPALPPAWVQSLLWSQLYAGWSYHKEGCASRHEALRLVARTISQAITAQPTAE